jgi:dihydropteroate synthase
MIWQCLNKKIDLSQRGMIMGILNTTPDSFSDGGTFVDASSAMKHAWQMITEGAEIIDVGGESTRPGAPEVDEDEEANRVIPVIQALRARWDGLISIDTSKSSVAHRALLSGADIVNDVSGLRTDPQMVDVCKDHRCGIIIMHMIGNPRTMQVNPMYHDVVAEVRAFFHERYHFLTERGIAAEALCFDPGIGFGKTPEHNWQLIEQLDQLSVHHRPLLLGVSRKSFIGHRLGNRDIAQRSWATVALTSMGRELGVMLHRVHEVKANLESLRMTEAIMGDLAVKNISSA